LSGDGDDHESMETGEFHAFYPASGSSTDGSTKSAAAWWRQLTPLPGRARWAPGSFVLRGTTTAYFCCGYDRVTTILHEDMWSIDLSALFTTEPPTTTTNDVGNDVNQNGTAPTTDSSLVTGGDNGSSSGGNNTSPGQEGTTTTTANGALMQFYAVVVMVLGLVLSTCT
jgi:hypothetical protein